MGNKKKEIVYRITRTKKQLPVKPLEICDIFTSVIHTDEPTQEFDEKVDHESKKLKLALEITERNDCSTNNAATRLKLEEASRLFTADPITQLPL